jgi:hypothetical protein
MKLQTAYATTVLDQDENKWIVYSGEERLAELPAILKEQEVMAVIRFGRAHELAGHAEGFAAGLAVGNKELEEKIKLLEWQVNTMATENVRLADILEAQ